MTDLDRIARDTPATYDRNAEYFDATRTGVLFERPWLERFAATLPKGGHILDLGCGTGHPIAGYFISQGFQVTGVDVAPAMLRIAARRFPASRWICCDMRALALDTRFDGILSWHGSFHLNADEQRALLPVLADHLRPGGTLMLTAGPEAGETTGHVGRDLVYHASLSEAEYRERLARSGVTVTHFVRNDPECDQTTVLMAQKRTA